MSAKEQVLAAIHRLPDDNDFRDISEEIAFLAALNEAECDIRDGRLVSNDQMEKRLEQWSAKSAIA